MATITRATIEQAYADLTGSIETARGIPASFYSDTFYQLEQETLFPRSWCAVTVGAAIPNPGDMVPIDLAGWPVLVLRARDGTIQAFHNICRHRGVKLVAEPGNAARITCAWHAWTYAIDGTLLATPEIGGAKVNHAQGFDKAELGLKPIRAGRWLDYVFINLDGAAPRFEDYIRPIEALFDGHAFDDLQPAMRVTESYDVNWKIGMEGGLEDYHLPFGHPQLNAHLYRNGQAVYAPGTIAGTSTDVSAAHEQGIERAWTARLPDLLMRDGTPLRRLYSLCLFPTATMLVTADHVMLGTLLPNGSARCDIDLRLYFDGNAATDPAYEDARQGTLAMWKEVIPQDLPFMQAAQATIGHRDAAGIATRFSPYWEDGLRRFQQLALEAVKERL